MATTGTVNSRIMKIYTGSAPGTAITCLTDASISMSTEMRDVTCKDSDGWNDALPARRSWTMSAEGNFAYDAANGARELWEAWNNQTNLTLAFKTSESGDYSYTGSGYLTSLEFSAPGTDENVTFSFELEGVGELSEVEI